MSWEKIGVIPEIIKAIEQPQLDWLLPTPVQDEAIPLILGGGDVMVAAETGSGKTAAFAIPILQVVYESLQKSAKKVKTNIKTKNSNNNNNNSGIADRLPSVVLSHAAKDGGLEIIDDNNLKAKSTGTWNGGRANVGVFSGKYYYEVTIVSGLCRVGWCTTAMQDYTIGTDRNFQSCGYGGTAKHVYGGNYDPYGNTFGAGDFIGCYIDLSRDYTVSYSHNGRWLGNAAKIKGNNNTIWYPGYCMKNGIMLFNFGELPFQYKPKGGYKGLQSANVKDTSVYYREQMLLQQSKNVKSNQGQPLAVILAPTRDLASQLYKDINDLGIFCKTPKINSVLLIGGQGVNKSIAMISKAHIVVGTIGSIVGMIKSSKIVLNKCKFFVCDEADRLCDKKMGNLPDVLAIYSRLPNGVQIMLFSATLHSKEIRDMSNKICKNPQWVDLKGKDFVPDTVEHCIIEVNPSKNHEWCDLRNQNSGIVTDGVHQQDRIQWNPYSRNLDKLTLSEGTKLLKPLLLKKVIDAFKMDQCLIFCRTRLDCDNLEKFLTFIGGGQKFKGKMSGGKENPYSCAGLHSGKRQNERAANLELFKKGEFRFLICTDVAARGIDIKHLPYVINVTMPAESENYIHRIGRVGRADKRGIAISLVSTNKEKVWYHSNCNTRGVGCYNTNLLEQGGCCTWYDEIKIVNEVEKRLGEQQIMMLPHDKLNPKDVSKFVEQHERKDPLVAQAQQKVQELVPTVTKLTKLEWHTQDQFLDIPNKFHKSWKKYQNRKFKIQINDDT